ncbi:hypothetical protein GJ496_009922 [Pomphorhynchus laevis]|nr:hypothetical protein GJ496_009922 [Pomphorhynchus laevis]
MVTNQKHKLVIFIRPRNVHRLPKNFYVTINASSKNSEEFNTMADNVVKINISVQAKYNIELSGHTEHDQLHWNNTKYVPTSLKRLSDIGPVVEHIYKIKNNGAFNIDLLNVQIKWPSYYSTFPEQHLLYLTTPPKLQRRFLDFDTNDFCTVHSAIVGKAAVNPLGLTKNAKSGFTSADHNSKAPKLATRIRRFINRQQYGEYTTTINCHVSNLQASQQLNILVRSRAWLHNYTNKSANIVAKSTCTITHPVHTSHGSTLQQYKTSIFTIIFIGEQLPLSKLPDLWMVTCAAGVGLILLLAIITALWSCGFFKRIRIHHKEFKINNSNQNISPSKYIEQSENFYPNSVAGTLNSFRYFDKDAEINHGHYYNKTDGCFQKATFL